MLLRKRILAALNFTEIQPLPYPLFIEDNVAQRLDATIAARAGASG